MALQRGTVIVLAIALLTGGMTYGVTQWRKVTPPTTTAPEKQPLQQLFNVTEAQIAGFSLTVTGQAQPLNFVQTRDEMGSWWLLTPEKQRASLGAVRFLMKLLVEAQAVESFVVTPELLADYGLTEPYATLTLQLTDGGDRRLTLGDLNFDRTKIYGRVDDTLTVWVLPIDFRHAVTRELGEWLESGQTTEGSSEHGGQPSP